MKGIATFLGMVVLMTVSAPVFVWVGSHVIAHYGSYASWIYGLLDAIGR
jgi:hypothetical protein